MLFAANSAAAAKLQLLAPALSRFFSNQRWQVNSVAVRVQPNASRYARCAAQRKNSAVIHTYAR